MKTLLFVLFANVLMAQTPVIGGGGSAVCVVTGTQTTGYVLTATDGSTGCDWESPGAATVDATALKNAWYIADGGTTNHITGTTTTTFPGAYAAGQAVVVKVANNNSGATDINVNSLGAKSVTKSGSTALASGNLIAGRDYLLVYDGTQFQLLNFTVIAADVPTLNQNTSGTAANLSGTPALPNGTTATTQSASDGSTKLATTAYVDTADALKAPLASPTFTGTPSMPTGTTGVTQSAHDNSTKLATTAYVDAASGGSGSAATPYITANGTNFFGPVFAVTKPPASSSLTWVNQGTATVATTTGGALVITAQQHSGDDLKFMHTSSYPSTPYTFTIGMIPQYFQNNYYCMGIAISDGTKFMVAGVGFNSSVSTCYYTHATATTSGVNIGSIPQKNLSSVGIWYVSLTDDGTTITVTNGPSLDQMWTAGTVTRATLGITPTQVGIYVDNNNNTQGSASAMFFHWGGI